MMLPSLEDEIDERVVALGRQRRQRQQEHRDAPDELAPSQAAGKVPALRERPDHHTGQHEIDDVVRRADQAARHAGVTVVGDPAEHTPQIPPCGNEVVRAEEHPCDNDDEKRYQQLSDFGQFPVDALFAERAFEGEVAAVDGAPDEEIPAGAVP